MKKTLITAVALAGCVGTQLFAQNVKEDVITFSLNKYSQASVSTSSAANAGNWSDPPIIYKTAATKKVATSDVLAAIAAVLHWPKTGYYSSKAQLVLVQPELGGFFGYPYAYTAAGLNNPYLFDQSSTTAGDNIRFAIGRNMTNNPITGALPPGHNQPWGQIYAKDYDSKGNVILCENVSFFFAIQVQECYDCFYLNSFITDSTFKFTARNGPPCCAGSSVTSGSGKDKYYMTLQFDNTLNNPYLNPYYGEDLKTSGYSYDYGWEEAFNGAWTNFYGWVGGKNYPHSTDGLYPNVIGLRESDDGIQPDGLTYLDPIKSSVVNPPDHHAWDIYTLRFSLNGILTYSWKLTFLNKADVYPDFQGSASYPVTGYGYSAKVCSLFDGSVSIAEKVLAASKCCLDQPWSYVDLGGGTGSPIQNGYYWFGIGDNDYYAALGSNWDAGYIENYMDDSGETHLGDDVQVNTDMDLSFHVNFDNNYRPMTELTWDDYPQPGFEGYWESWLLNGDYNGEIYDWQTPQEDSRPADHSQD